MKRFAFLSTVVSVFIFGSAVVYAGDTNYQNMDTMNMQNMSSASAQTGAMTNAADQSLPTVNIQGFVFASSDVIVPLGTTVRWINKDNVVHTVTADVTGGPSSGQLKPGQSYTYTFKQVGTFHYHCAIHPAMTGSVTVSAPTAPATSQDNSSTTATPNDSSSDNGTANATGNINSNENEQTTVVQTQPSVSSATTPSVLVNTGTKSIIPIFVVSSLAAAGLYSLYLRRKLFRG